MVLLTYTDSTYQRLYQKGHTGTKSIYIYISKELSKENKRTGERYSEKSQTQGNNSQFQIKWILAFSP